ncbi:GATA transcription factor LreB [Aspergillus chevalieri]|uniref:Blue light receptor n=1 Tax=Aspergillus chevalieri TaxID=182096 RepID=A0A7R7VER5_ASPCH|nr:blue light receptor [Aspergillus chevalieri]BCR82912.1 blue light receptor [Aspergillus chevalieri]
MEPASIRHGQAYGLQIDGGNSYTIQAQRMRQAQSLTGDFEAQTVQQSGARSWPQRAIAEMKDMFLLLSADGTITYASPSCQSITGYTTKQLEGKPLSYFTHQDDRAIFSEELDQCVATGCALHLHFRFSRVGDSHCILEASGHPHMSNQGGNNADGNSKPYDGVFIICRPYPTKSAQFIDSFLEHKIENIRLMQQVTRLKEEEEEESKANKAPYARSDHSSSSNKTYFNQPPRFIASNPAGFTGTIIPDFITSAEEYESSDTLEPEQPKPFAAENLSHIEGIEVLTGLHYGEGERSQGISTGIRRGRLIQCDTDFTKIDQQVRSMEESDRRKRLRGEYRCSDCGTSDSPEWRKGPKGPKTLCNACGLRWAKKKRQTPPT